MNRFATLIAVVTLGTIAVAWRKTDEPSSPFEPVTIQTAWSNEQKVQDMVTQYRAFKGTLNATIESLRGRHIHLKEAHAIVREASNQHSPKYLRLLVLSDTGATTDERLARNLVGHVRNVEEFHPTRPSPLASLDQELRELLAELQK